MANHPHAPHPRGINVEFMSKAVDITEALTNLTYLICLDSGDPRKVRSYAMLAEERLRALGDLFRSARWEN